MTQIEGPAGTNTSIGYDSQGNVALLLDPLNNQQTLSSTANNRLKSLTSGAGNATGFTYDKSLQPDWNCSSGWQHGASHV